MRILLFSAKPYDRRFFEKANTVHGHELLFTEARLNVETASLAQGALAVCAFVNDRLDEAVLWRLAAGGTRYILLRCAGYNLVDRSACERLGLSVAFVPHYSPNAVAEHTVALILALNRKTHRAYARVREGNFSIDGLMGFDLVGCTVGLIGLGRIGRLVGKIMRGFGCRILAYDPFPPTDLASDEVILKKFGEVMADADIVSLHCPLTPDTRHLIDAATLSKCRPGLMLINTSRGGLIDTPAVVEALKGGQVASLGIDVYEEEAEFFYEDLSERIISDDVLSRLISFPNVLITAHQGFFTKEALTSIAETTLQSATGFQNGTPPENALPALA